MSVKRAAVLGCGSGGMTMAVDLGLKGFKVNLFDFPEYDRNLRRWRNGGASRRQGILRVASSPM